MKKVYILDSVEIEPKESNGWQGKITDKVTVTELENVLTFDVDNGRMNIDKTELKALLETL